MSVMVLDELGILQSCGRCGQRNRLHYERLGQSFRCGKCQNDLRAPDAPIDVATPETFFAVITRSQLPVLVDFWAPWCGPCKMVAPELVKVASDGAGKWLVVKVNTEQLPIIAQRFEISGIPTLALFADGQEVARQSGAMPAARIRQFIEQAQLRAH